MPPILIIVAVDKEAHAVRDVTDAQIVVAGIGRTNAACATTAALLASPDTPCVISAGIAGSLPPHDLAIGDVVLATSCVYAEEGLVTDDGFSDVRAIGFPLGDFDGNAVPIETAHVDRLRAHYRTGAIATVATCSGTDDAAAEIVRRTGACAEAMEGAAVVHAARRLGVPALEVRAISNRTGDRAAQAWDLDAALRALGPAVRDVVERLRAHD